MKKLKKTRAKLPKNEKIIGSSVTSSELNQKRIKKLGGLKKK